MSEWIEQAGRWTFQNSLEGGILILLLAAVAIGGHRWLSPGQRSLIWGLAVLRLVLPHAPQSGFSLFNLLPDLGFPVAHVERSNDAIAALSEADSLMEIVAMPQVVMHQSLDLAAVLGGLWLGGVMAVLGYALVQQFRALRFVRQLPESTDPRLCEILRDCMRRSKMDESDIRLVESPRLGEIGVFGILRGRCLVIPRNMMEEYSETEIRGIFLHELAHVQRWDLLRNWMVFVIEAVHWFNPLSWWLGSRLRGEREVICDQMALRKLSEPERHSYGEALLKTLEYGLRTPGKGPAFVPLLSSKSELKHRLTMIKKPHLKNRSGAQVVILGVAVAACAATFTSALAREVEEGEDARKRDGSRRGPESVEGKAVDRIGIPLEIYLNKRGTYVRGKRQRPDDLAAMVRRLAGDGVVLTVEDGVSHEAVGRTVESIRSAGAREIKLESHTPIDGKLAAVEKIESRLEGTQGPLGVYLSNRGMWIKGTRLPAGFLSQFVRDYGREGVVLSAEPDVPHWKVEEFIEQMDESGIKNVRITSPPKKKEKRNAARLSNDLRR